MMQRKAWLSLILGVILFVAHPAHAQFIGDRMRITTEDEEVIGQLTGYNANSLRILTDSIEQSIAYADIVRLQRSRGGRPRYKKRVLIGLGAGMVAGLAVASIVPEHADKLVTPAGIGLLGGMGGLAHAGIRREKWERVDIPDESNISVTPEIGVQLTDIPAQDSVSVTPDISAPSPGLSALENRMRITTVNEEKIIGRLKEYDADSLTILTGFTEQSIAYADMAQLQRSLGIRSYYRDGAGIGLKVGVGGSIAAGAILRNGWATLIGIGLFTPALTLGGTVLGAAIRQERWKRLDIPDPDAAFVMLDMGADPSGRLALGNRLQITTENGEKLIGPLKGYNADSLTILANSAEQSIAYADMARLQKSLGRRSYYGKGAVIGFSAGMVSGLSNLDMGLALRLGGVGGLTGAVIGARIRGERWKPVDIPEPEIASVRCDLSVSCSFDPDFRIY